VIRTALSHPNKALVIYWGNEDDKLRIPTRSSLSITLQGLNHPLNYIVTLRTMQSADRDRIFIDGTEAMGEVHTQFVRHLDIMRAYTRFKEKIEVSTTKTFPVGSGLAGSAASASAMAEAFLGLVGKNANRKLVSIMARRGSGSASRSVFGGSVVWHKGDNDASSYAEQLFDEKHWDIRSVIALVSSDPKKVRSVDGMNLSKRTCPELLYSGFTSVSSDHIRQASSAMAARDIEKLGAIYDRENTLFRQVCLKTTPRLDYWAKATHDVFEKVVNLRNDSISAYAGTDAGPNVHILTLPKHVEQVSRVVGEVEGVREIIHCRVGEGSHLIQQGLL
jgi:diphosphomevalonate decarboxylase